MYPDIIPTAASRETDPTLHCTYIPPSSIRLPSSLSAVPLQSKFLEEIEMFLEEQKRSYQAGANVLPRPRHGLCGRAAASPAAQGDRGFCLGPPALRAKSPPQHLAASLQICTSRCSSSEETYKFSPFNLVCHLRAGDTTAVLKMVVGR